MATTVYKYGCRPPTENAQLVREQLWRAHRYRNLLVEIERARRAAVRSEIANVADPDRRKEIAQSINDRAADMVRRARAVCDVYWGTYLLVEQAIDAARRSKTDPHFARWDGAGRVGVQLQGGLTVADAAAGTDTRLRIVPTPDTGNKQPGSRRYGQQHLVCLRVGSVGRAPVWTTVRATFHRLLPRVGTIKWAWLQLSRIGPDERWFVHFVVDSPAAVDDKVDTARTGTVAIDLGWRMRPDGMRMGYWLDDRGRHDELVVPKTTHEDLAHARSIGAIRDRCFNEFRQILAVWMQTAVCPEWLQREADTISQWKSADRLARLAERWRSRRFASDEAIFGPHETCARDRNAVLDCVLHLECWRRKNRHLYRWEAHETAKVLGRRTEHYRRWAAILARTYRRVVIEDFDLRAVAGRHGLSPTATDGEKVRADNASSRRHAGAPGIFRQAIYNACRSRGTEILVVPAEYTTIICALCGCAEPWDAAPAIDHRCAGCGTTWDQDYNAAWHILRRGAASGPAAPDGGQVLAGGKSARQKRFAKRRDRNRDGDGAQDVECSQTIVQPGDTPAQFGVDEETLAQEIGS